MNTKQTIKIFGIFGMTMAATFNSNADATAPETPCTNTTDTLRVAHVRYTPEYDYVNMEHIKNGQPTEQYVSYIFPSSLPLTMAGDTILIERQNHIKKLINISAKSRTK